MKERPIIFSGDMVRAILDGRKTMTRRVIKPQPHPSLVLGDTLKTWIWRPIGNPCLALSWQDLWTHPGLNLSGCAVCRYGQSGDRLWVRETWGAVSKTEDPAPLEECKIEYRADLPIDCTDQPGEWPVEDAKGNEDAPHWSPSIHMPRWASRINLEITEVRVERLREITLGDIEAEGLNQPFQRYGKGGIKIMNGSNYFAAYWDSLNAKRGYSWESNPWVWVISFKRVL